jgi:hypothetical protein
MEIRKVIATAGAFALIAGAAFAQDISSFLNQIFSYLQQNPQVVQQVQQAVGQSVPSACQGVTFTRTLKAGMSGNDVKCLQALLNVSPQTGYFGPLTKAAVVKFQEDHADEILAPLGLTKGTGVVGPSTRAELNKMVSGAPQVQIPTVEQAKSIWDMFVEALKKELGVAPTTPTAPTAGEEGTLTAEAMAVPTNVTVYEGDQNVAVMAFKVKAKNSAITIDRVDLTFNAGGSIVYRYINHVSVYDGNNAVKGMDLNSSTMDKSGSDYTVRLSGLNVKVEKDSEKVLTVKVSAVPVYPSGGPSSMTVQIAGNGIRGTDAAGIQQYAPTPAGVFSKSFSLAGVETGSVEASLNSNSPKEGIQIVSEDDDTEITLAAFDLKAKKQNVTIDTVTVNATASVTSSVIALRLYDGSTLLSEKTPSSFSAAGTTTVTFDGDMEIDVAKDTTKTLTVKALIAKNTNNATYIVALASVSGTDANENGITVSGTPVSGETQYVYTKAPVISNISAQVDAKDNNATTGAETIVGKITFSVTAKGSNIYISASSTDLAVKAEPSSGTAQDVSNVVLSTSADKGNWGYKVPKDQTVSFTVDATKVPGSAGYWRIAITQLKWNTTDSGTNTTTWTNNWAVKDLKTGYVYLTAE